MEYFERGTPRTTSSRKTSPQTMENKMLASSTWHQWRKKITISNFSVQGLSSNPPTVLSAHQLFHWTLLYKGLFQLLCLGVFFTASPNNRASLGCLSELLPHTNLPPLTASMPTEETTTQAENPEKSQTAFPLNVHQDVDGTEVQKPNKTLTC